MLNSEFCFQGIFLSQYIPQQASWLQGETEAIPVKLAQDLAKADAPLHGEECQGQQWLQPAMLQCAQGNTAPTRGVRGLGLLSSGVKSKGTLSAAWGRQSQKGRGESVPSLLHPADPRRSFSRSR